MLYEIITCIIVSAVVVAASWAIALLIIAWILIRRSMDDRDEADHRLWVDTRR